MSILRCTNLLNDKLQLLVEQILRDCSYHNLPFEIFETGRTIERQKILKKRGSSKTLKSKHIITFDEDGMLSKKSDAVDFVLRYEHNGKMVWSWAQYGDKAQRDRDMAYYKMLSVMVTTRYPELLKKSFITRIISGGNWKHFHDYPHYQI